MKSNGNVYYNSDMRLYYLSDQIDNSSIGQLCHAILVQLEEDNQKEITEKDFQREPIKLYINSYGGYSYEIWALIDIIINSKTPIYTYCTGYAMSAAFPVFLAGHKRFCTEHTTFMYHQMYCKRSATYQDLIEDIVETTHLQKMAENFIIEKTKLTQSNLDSIREKKQEFYIHADDALKLGIVHQIIA